MAKLGHEVEYLIARSAEGIAQRLSAAQADRFAAGLGRTVYRVWGRRREIALTNMRKALGDEMGEALIQRTVKTVFENMGRSLVEFARFPRIGQEGVRELVVPFDLSEVEKARSRGSGALICTAHFGNWELLAASYAACGHPIDVLVGIQANPRMHAVINRYRRSVGSGVIDVGIAARGVLKSLRSNRLVGIAADQHSHSGLPITFFGRRATASRGPATFAVKTGAPMIPCLLVRERYDRHVMLFGETMYPPEGGTDKDIDEMTVALHTFYEARIREHPEQWMWTHRRWKAAKD